MSQRNVDVVRSTYEAFGQGDMDAVASLLAATEWHEAEGMPYGGTFTGAEAIFANVLGPISQDVDGFAARPDEILDGGDEKVVSLGRYSGQGSNGPWTFPTRTSGRSTTARSCASSSTRTRSCSARLWASRRRTAE